jgi:spermidine/putrescine-binding protein
MRTRRLTIKVLTLVCVAAAVNLLTSCQSATEEAGVATLSVLEWSGFEKPKFYPEYLASYGGPPEFTIFAHTNDALQRMRAGYQVDLAHLCTGQMLEARDAGLIKPIDPDRIPRWGEITPELLDLPDVRIDFRPSATIPRSSRSRTRLTKCSSIRASRVRPLFPRITRSTCILPG